MTFAAYQDDVVLRLRRLDQLFRYRLCCRLHVMTCAKLCGVCSVVWSLLLCLAVLLLPLTKLYLLAECCVLFAACTSTVALFVAVSRRAPRYVCPFVTFCSFASAYCLFWFVGLAINYVRSPHYYYSNNGSALSAPVVALCVWASTSLVYAYMSLVGYHLYRYLLAYRLIYRSAALNAMQVDAPSSAAEADETVLFDKRDRPEDNSGRRMV